MKTYNTNDKTPKHRQQVIFQLTKTGEVFAGYYLNNTGKKNPELLGAFNTLINGELRGFKLLKTIKGFHKNRDEVSHWQALPDSLATLTEYQISILTGWTEPFEYSMNKKRLKFAKSTEFGGFVVYSMFSEKAKETAFEIRDSLYELIVK